MTGDVNSENVFFPLSAMTRLQMLDLFISFLLCVYSFTILHSTL